jgi:hypothetical protein
MAYVADDRISHPNTIQPHAIVQKISIGLVMSFRYQGPSCHTSSHLGITSRFRYWSLQVRADVSRFEWIEGGKPYREWLIPASIVNTGTVRRVTEEEEDELARAARKALYATLTDEQRADIHKLRASVSEREWSTSEFRLGYCQGPHKRCAYPLFPVGLTHNL